MALYALEFVFYYDRKDEDDQPDEEYLRVMMEESLKEGDYRELDIESPLPHKWTLDAIPYGDEATKQIKHHWAEEEEIITLNGFIYKKIRAAE